MGATAIWHRLESCIAINLHRTSCQRPLLTSCTVWVDEMIMAPLNRGVRLTIARVRDEADGGYGHENGHNQLTSDRRPNGTAQKLFSVTYYLRWPLSASRSGGIDGGAKAHRIRGALSIRCCVVKRTVFYCSVIYPNFISNV